MILKPQVGEDTALLVEARKRFFMRHQLRLRAYRKNGEPLRLYRDDDTIDLHTVVKAAIAAGRAELTLKQKDIVTLTKITHLKERKMVVLLFRRSDPDASSPVFEHVQTKRLKNRTKEETKAWLFRPMFLSEPRPYLTLRPLHITRL